MRCLNFAALGLGFIATALASPVDAAATTNLVTAPSINQTVAVRQIRPPDDPTMDWPRPECKFKHGFIRDWYVVKVFKIPETITTEQVCKDLWEGLAGHWTCTVSSPHGCGISGNKGEADVEWWFHVPLICQKTEVEAAFDWATTSKYGGPIVCELM